MDDTTDLVYNKQKKNSTVIQDFRKAVRQPGAAAATNQGRQLNERMSKTVVHASVFIPP